MSTVVTQICSKYCGTGDYEITDYCMCTNASSIFYGGATIVGAGAWTQSIVWSATSSPTLNTFKWVNYTKKLKISFFLKIILKDSKMTNYPLVKYSIHCKRGIVITTDSLLFWIQMSEQNSLLCGGELHDNLPHSQSTFLHTIIPSWQLTVSMHQIN